MYDGPPVAPEDVVSVYVVLNGSLTMSPGKVASQAFHCGWLYARYLHIQGDAWGDAWTEQGRRVSVRLAETAHVFDRVVRECDGFLQRDEGLQEVEHGSVTAFVSVPYRRADAPKILAHKRIQAYGRG